MQDLSFPAAAGALLQQDHLRLEEDPLVVPQETAAGDRDLTGYSSGVS